LADSSSANGKCLIDGFFFDLTIKFFGVNDEAFMGAFADNIDTVI